MSGIKSNEVVRRRPRQNKENPATRKAIFTYTVSCEYVCDLFNTCACRLPLAMLPKLCAVQVMPVCSV